jgi:hypothetical protein
MAPPAGALSQWVRELGIRVADLEEAERRARDLGRPRNRGAGLLLTAAPLVLALLLLVLLALSLWGSSG